MINSSNNIVRTSQLTNVQLQNNKNNKQANNSGESTIAANSSNNINNSELNAEYIQSRVNLYVNEQR